MSRTILIVTANPSTMRSLRLDREVREIRNCLERSWHRKRIRIEPRVAVLQKDLRRAILDLNPVIVHFCGHGNPKGIILEDDNGLPHVVGPSALQEFFGIFSDSIRCVVLNACYSAAQAQAISSRIDFVVGIPGTVVDENAIQYATAFYDGIGAGQTVLESHDLAVNAMGWAESNSTGLHEMPELFVRYGAEANVPLFEDKRRRIHLISPPRDWGKRGGMSILMICLFLVATFGLSFGLISKQLSIFLNNQAVAALQESDLVRAGSYLHWMTWIDPTNIVTYYHRGNLYEQQQEFQQAFEEYEVAYSAGLDFAGINLSRLMVRQGNPSSAAQILSHLLHYGDNEPEVLYAILKNRGWARLKMGRLKDAESDLKRAIELQPETAAGYCLLGITLKSAGRLEEAGLPMEECRRRVREDNIDEDEWLFEAEDFLEDVGS